MLCRLTNFLDRHIISIPHKAEAVTRDYAEAAEKRAQEDHLHMVAVHQLLLDRMAAQDQELAILHEAMQVLLGNHPRFQLPDAPVTNQIALWDLHPRGETRAQDGDHCTVLKKRLACA